MNDNAANPWINKVDDEAHDLAEEIIDATLDYDDDIILVACTIVVGITIKRLASNRADAQLGIDACCGDLNEHIDDLFRIETAGNA
jgi:hypothetical protein